MLLSRSDPPALVDRAGYRQILFKVDPALGNRIDDYCLRLRIPKTRWIRSLVLENLPSETVPSSSSQPDGFPSTLCSKLLTVPVIVSPDRMVSL